MKSTFRWIMPAAVVAIMLISFSFRSAGDKNFADKKADMIKEWERAKAYTKEYLDAATEEAYSLKPTPEMRTFGQQMLHLTEGNYALSAAASGKASPYKFGDLEKGAMKTKAEISKATLDGYDFAIAAIKDMDEAKFATIVKLFNMEMPAEVVLAKVFEHQTHHRGQTTVYLRLAGVTPPQEKLF